MSIVLYFCLLIVSIYLIPSLQAQQTHNWTGSISSSFGNSLNWSPIGVPGENDTVVFGIGGTVTFGNDFTNTSLQHTGGNTIFRPSSSTTNRNYSITGATNISGGSLTIDPVGAARLNMNLGGIMTVSGSSLFRVNAGTLTHNGSLRVGSGSEASMALDGANTVYQNNSTALSAIGWATNGFGFFTVQNQATANFAGALRIGGGPSTGAQVNVLSGGTLSMANANIGDGTTFSQWATVNLSGSGSSITQTGASTLSLGKASGGAATINVNQGGSYTTGTGLTTIRGTGVLNVGNASSAGTFHAVGNILVQGGQINLTNANSEIITPELTIDGGTVTRDQGGLRISSIATIGTNNFSIGQEGGSGTLTITGGGVLNNSGAAVIGNLFGSTGTVTVSGMGSQWVNPSILYVGYNGAGMMTIESGGLVENSDGFIGSISGSIASATVTGTGSQWNNYQLTVAGSGQGNLDIEGGGSVSSTFGYVGRSSGGLGEVNVSGTDSQWNLTSNLLVGDSGEGTLSIQDGGLVFNQTGYIGALFDGVGTATVTGNGSHWQNNAELYVGRDGQGTLTVGSGGVVSSAEGVIGRFDNGNGTASIQGSGSAWNNSGELTIGYEGQGNLNITDGGIVSNTFGRVGRESGSTGTVIVSGSGTTWNNSQSLSIANSGSGELLIENGGLVTSDIGSLGGVGGSGTASVIGSGSEWQIATTLVVGGSGQGELNIEAGGLVSSINATIANASFSEGTVNVVGTGSQWEILGSSFRIGNTGSGTLNIIDGGRVLSASASSTIGFSSFAPESIVNVSGPGSQWITDGLQVGRGTSGTLNILDGGYVSSAGGLIGASTNDFGAVTVTGAGSSWENSHTLTLGSSSQGVGGNGSLVIEDGGLVTNTSANIANFGQSTASVLVSGAGSHWGNSGILNVGFGGEGSLTIENGGSVSSTMGRIAFGTNSVSSVMVSGSNSEWNNLEDLTVGNSGDGTLNVADGGRVYNADGFIAFNSNSLGSVSVSGLNSLWHNTQSLTLGGSDSEAGGTGELTVESGGTVRVGETMRIWETGTLNILGGTLHLDGTDYQRTANNNLNFQFGTLRLGGDRMLGLDAAAADMFGTVANITSGKTLQVDGTATLLAPVLINGGTFRVGTLTDGSLMSLNSGTFHLTSADLNIGNAGIFGNNVALGNQQQFQIDQHTSIASEGIFTVGSGGRFQAGSLTNQGQILIDGVNARIGTTGSGLVNQGLLWGSGQVEGNFTNASGGIVHVQTDRVMTFNSVVDNQAGGRIMGRGTLIAPGIANYGELLFSGGFTDIHSPIVGHADSKMIVSGGSSTTVIGDVEFKGGSELRLSTASSATFFDHVQFRDGALLTGEGQAYFEGSMGIGNSPSRQEFGFNVTLGQTSNLIIEIAGTDSALPAYDQFVFYRDLTLLGGTLTVDLIGLTAESAAYQPQVGDTFQIFEVHGDWTGQFGSYDLPELYPSFYWNKSELYTQGLLRIQGLLTETDSLLSSVHRGTDKNRSIEPPGTTFGGGSSQSIPEPSAFMLVGAALGLLATGRSRKIVGVQPLD